MHKKTQHDFRALVFSIPYFTYLRLCADGGFWDAGNTRFLSYVECRTRGQPAYIMIGRVCHVALFIKEVVYRLNLLTVSAMVLLRCSSISYLKSFLGFQDPDTLDDHVYFAGFVGSIFASFQQRAFCSVEAEREQIVLLRYLRNVVVACVAQSKDPKGTILLFIVYICSRNGHPSYSMGPCSDSYVWSINDKENYD